MRILFAVDDQMYSGAIVPEAARISANTWADITMLTVQPSDSELSEKKAEFLRQYKDIFLSSIEGGGFPYYTPSSKESFEKTTEGWQGTQGSGDGSKSCLLKIRCGNTAKEIINETGEGDYDLVILGGSSPDCQWKGEAFNLPQKVAEEAACSALVIKRLRPASKIIGCLDQSQVSQESLEMINQIVTLHQADLKIIGLTGPKGLKGKGDVEAQMANILNYYTARDINAWITLVEKNALEDFISSASRDGIMAVWMGKKSMFDKLFSQNLVEKLIGNSQSSVLILR